MKEDLLHFGGAVKRRCLHRPPRGAAAFTLVELLLVLVMIALLSGTLAVGLAGRQDRMALRTSAEDLAAVARYGLRQAFLRGTVHRLAFDATGSAYRLEVFCPSGGSGDYAPVAGSAGRWRNFPSSVRIGGLSGPDGRHGWESGQVLVFDPSGGGFCGSVELVNRLGAVLAVEVAAPMVGIAEVES